MANRVLGIIPARANSIRIADKNMRLLSGQPLIEYTLSQALKAKSLDGLLVTTDSEKILDYTSKYENIFLHQRPEFLATSDTQMYDVVQDVINNAKTGFEPTILIVLQPTSPFRTYKHIDESIEYLSNNSKFHSIASVSELSHRYFPEKLGTIDKSTLKSLDGGSYMYNPRTSFPKSLYYRNGAIYGVRKREFISKNTLLPNPVLGYVMENAASLDIDLESDFNYAEFKLLGDD